MTALGMTALVKHEEPQDPVARWRDICESAAEGIPPAAARLRVKAARSNRRRCEAARQHVLDHRLGRSSVSDLPRGLSCRSFLSGLAQASCPDLPKLLVRICLSFLSGPYSLSCLHSVCVFSRSACFLDRATGFHCAISLTSGAEGNRTPCGFSGKNGGCRFRRRKKRRNNRACRGRCLVR